MPSFDVTVKVNNAEVLNAVDQTKRELSTRYDFKGSKSSIELQEKEMEITLLADDNMKLSALQEMSKQKLAKRGISLKSVSYEPETQAGGGMLRQIIKIKQSLTPEELKKLAKIIKDKKMKVTPSIQGEQLRISGKKRDDLQQCMKILESEAEDLDLEFDNFRD